MSHERIMAQDDYELSADARIVDAKIQRWIDDDSIGEERFIHLLGRLDSFLSRLGQRDVEQIMCRSAERMAKRRLGPNVKPVALEFIEIIRDD